MLAVATYTPTSWTYARSTINHSSVPQPRPATNGGKVNCEREQQPTRLGHPAVASAAVHLNFIPQVCALFSLPVARRRLPYPNDRSLGCRPRTPPLSRRHPQRRRRSLWRVSIQNTCRDRAKVNARRRHSKECRRSVCLVQFVLRRIRALARCAAWARATLRNMERTRS